MFSKSSALLALIAVAEARFGQEQTPVSAITALSNFGNPGEAATLAGGVPGSLLAATNPCQKLTLADKIVSTLGNDPAVIAGAQQLVAAEQNTNPFVVSIPSICSDPTLPATAELRGIVPLIDPATAGSDVENANQATSLKTPFNADGLSVAEVMAANGFSNLTAVAQDGTKSTVGGGNANAGGASTGTVSAGNSSASNGTAATSAAASATATLKCSSGKKGKGSKTTAAAATAATTTAAAAATSAAASDSTGNANTGAAAGAAAGAGAVNDPVTGTFAGFQASSLGLDFGTCTPTIKFEESLNGRKAGEFTFQAQDPAVNKGQQEALNPNIITNRICDQLTNVCNAADDAKAACLAAKAQISALGTKDASTADAWNTALGFAGTNINPDNAPQTGLVGHT